MLHLQYIFFKKSNLIVTTIGSGDLNSRSLYKKKLGNVSQTIRLLSLDPIN